MGMKTGYLHIDGNEAMGRAPAMPHHWSVAIVAVIVGQWLLWQGSALGAAVGTLFVEPGILGMFGHSTGYVVANLFYLLIPFGAIAALSIFLTQRFDGRRAVALGVDRRTIPLALVWSVAGVLTATPLIFVIAANAPPLNRVIEGALVLIPATIVQAGAEEVLFRGVLLSILAARYGVRAGLVGSALLFGAWHLYFGQPWIDAFITFAFTFVFGLTAGIVTLHCANLGPAIALHVVWNVAADLHGASSFGNEFWSGWVATISQVWTYEDIANGEVFRILVLPLTLETLIVFAACRDTLNRLLSADGASN